MNNISTKTLIARVFSLAIFFVIWFSCTNNNGFKEQAKVTNKKISDSNSSCSNTQTIMDPNNTKPMALNMRAMAAQADSIKSALTRGEKIDSLKYQLIRFYLSEPTDPSVLEPLFFNNASIYEKAYRNLMNQHSNQKEAYNAMIGACINCHQSYCSGPLKRIRKLVL
ncbi:MAG: hypothetical protein ACK4K9_01495 [Bacteroidia bacterium]